MTAIRLDTTLALGCALLLGCGLLEERDERGRTPLMLAAAAGDTDRVAALIARGADVGATVTGNELEVFVAFLSFMQPVERNDEGWTALHYAVAGSHLGAVEALLAAGAEPDAAAGRGETPLGLATAPEIVGRLVEAGAPVDPADGHEGPLLYAARRGDLASLTLLLDAGADPDAATRSGETPLLVAVQGGHREMVRLLLARGARSDRPGPPHGWTPLMWAERRGRPEIAALLRAAGATRDGRAEQALFAAIRADDAEAVRVALADGADPNLPDQSGDLALVHAAQGAGPEVVRALLGAGARLDAGGLLTPLVAATQRGRLDTLRVLVEAGADPRSQPTRVLPAAAAGGRLELVRYYLELGLDPTAGGGPLRAAVYGCHLEVLELLLDAGADPNVGDRHGTRPIDTAVGRGCREGVARLLDAGAVVERRGEDWSPLMSAAMSGDTELVELLLEAGADPGKLHEGRKSAAFYARVNHHPELAARLEREAAGRRAAP